MANRTSNADIATAENFWGHKYVCTGQDLAAQKMHELHEELNRRLGPWKEDRFLMGLPWLRANAEDEVKALLPTELEEHLSDLAFVRLHFAYFQEAGKFEPKEMASLTVVVPE